MMELILPLESKSLFFLRVVYDPIDQLKNFVLHFAVQGWFAWQCNSLNFNFCARELNFVFRS